LPRRGFSFIQAFSKIGLIPDAGSTWLLPQRVGMARAMALAMTGDKLPGQAGQRVGNDLGRGRRRDCVVAAQAGHGRKAGRMPTKALVATRNPARATSARPCTEQLDVERDTQSAMGRTHDYIEGVMAFREKRPAQFKGRMMMSAPIWLAGGRGHVGPRHRLQGHHGHGAGACEPGRAVLRMQVRERHLNGHKICHGGFIFTLADSTFAFACNSHNKVTVAAGCSIEFLKPGQLGDVLTCEGVEQTLSGRHGIYDMKVSNQRGEVVAMFRGKSASIAGTVVPEETA
jgi:acyl-CoA thioesterase